MRVGAVRALRGDVELEVIVMNKKDAIVWLLRLGLGGLFAFAGVMKAADPSSFAIEIHNYQLMPSFAPLFAATLPAVEIVLGLAVIAGPRAWARAGALGVTLLSVMFTVAVVTVVARGINITCGCFGVGGGPVTMVTVVRDVALVLASGLLVRLLYQGQPEPAPSQSL